LPEFEECAKDFFEKKTLGPTATKKVLVEEFLQGEELSFMMIVSGTDYALMPVSQDHKRLLDKNKGPNTGGMGAFAPVKSGPKRLKKIEDKILKPTIDGMNKEHFEYKGVLYVGIMMVKEEPYVLEYNVRFGDPEAQVQKLPKMSWKKQAAVCVVIAAPGYPENPQKGIKIAIDRNLAKPNDTTYLLHASTASHQGYYTNGGRVLNAVGVDKTLKVARKKAYDMIKGVTFEGMQYRKDIADVKKG
jgi:phosphoribosylamine--glycine ligase